MTKMTKKQIVEYLIQQAEYSENWLKVLASQESTTSEQLNRASHEAVIYRDICDALGIELSF